jgi:uncharacterized protein with HEPN domain
MRDDRLRLLDISGAADSLRNFIHGKTREDLSANPLLLSAVLHQLYVIGEAAAHVSKEIKDRHPGVPWKVIYGFRNYIAHEYFSLDVDIVWQTVAQDVPELGSQIDQILRTEFP